MCSTLDNIIQKKMGLDYFCKSCYTYEVKQMTTKTQSLAVICISSTLLAFSVFPAQAATKTTVKKKVVKKEQIVPRRLDGVLVPKSQSNLWPVAVMIDNHTAARPQAGLDKASIIYESLAEGGIPRFMAIFADRNQALIGPVRSTRPYFVKYAAEYSAAIAHAGGSPDGLKMVKSMKLLSLWAIKGNYAKYFFRRGYGVHSLFTTGAKIAQALKQARIDKKKPTYQPYKFSSDAKLSQRGKKQSVIVDLGAGKAYDLKFTYDRASNSYLRTTGYYVHRDKLSGKQLKTKNVILLQVPKEKVLDKKGRLDLLTVGRGKGVLLKNGIAYPITWSKKTPRARTIFKYQKNGKEVTFVRGQLWVVVVPQGHKYTITK